MDWTSLTAIATVVSTLVLLAGAIIAVHELDHMARDRYVTVTNTLLEIWESPDFQKAQLWILYDLDTSDWEEFVAKHGGKYGEEAIVRVGSFYNQIGTLTVEGLLPSPYTLLRSIGGYAIAIWEKISPLVEQARRKEISELFANFEWLVSAAYQTYKPGHPHSLDQDYLGDLERLAGTVAGEDRPGLRIFRGLGRKSRRRMREAIAIRSASRPLTTEPRRSADTSS